MRHINLRLTYLLSSRSVSLTNEVVAACIGHGARFVVSVIDGFEVCKWMTDVGLKAKESWEMDAPEKLEQSEISKNKGTNYFKV